MKRDDAVLVPGCGNSRLPEDMAEDGYRSIHNIDISAVVIEQQRERYQGHPHERFISFQHMNACALEFPDETFDAVIAKVRAAESFLARACARALDALSVFSPQALVDVVMCGEGHAENVANMCMEVRRSRRCESRRKRAGEKARRGSRRPGVPEGVDRRPPRALFDARFVQVSRVLKPNGIFMIISYRDDYFEVRARDAGARPRRCGVSHPRAGRGARADARPRQREQRFRLESRDAHGEQADDEAQQATDGRQGQPAASPRVHLPQGGRGRRELAGVVQTSPLPAGVPRAPPAEPPRQALQLAPICHPTVGAQTQ